MEVKVFELRDEGTAIPLMGARLYHGDDYAKMFWILESMSRSETTKPPDRAYPVAHKYIIENWAKLKDGDVVDVQFILGETKAPKVSERGTLT